MAQLLCKVPQASIWFLVLLTPFRSMARTEHSKHILKSAVRAYHVYRSNWEPEVSEIHSTSIETDNIHNCNAITCIDSQDQVVGHIAREHAHVLKHFIPHGGTVTVEVLSTKYVRSVTAGGLEIPVDYILSGSFRLVKKAVELLEQPWVLKNKNPMADIDYNLKAVAFTQSNSTLPRTCLDTQA